LRHLIFMIMSTDFFLLLPFIPVLLHIAHSLVSRDTTKEYGFFLNSWWIAGSFIHPSRSIAQYSPEIELRRVVYNIPYYFLTPSNRWIHSMTSLKNLDEECDASFLISTPVSILFSNYFLNALCDLTVNYWLRIFRDDEILYNDVINFCSVLISFQMDVIYNYTYTVAYY
jgi:hypothetical protein